MKNFSVGVIYEDGEIPRLLSSSLLKICSLVCPSHTNFAKIFSKNKYSQSLPFDGTLIELDNLLPMIFLFPSIVVFLLASIELLYRSEASVTLSLSLADGRNSD